MEALGLLRGKVVTGGWSSPAYREFRDFAPDLCKDDTEGYGFLLSLLYDELALDLPGLFGKVGLTELFPIPASTLRAVIDANSGIEVSAWAGSAMDQGDTLGEDLVGGTDNKIHTLDDAVVAELRAIGEAQTEAWAAEMEEKGLPGAAMVEDARALVAKHSEGS